MEGEKKRQCRVEETNCVNIDSAKCGVYRRGLVPPSRRDQILRKTRHDDSTSLRFREKKKGPNQDGGRGREKVGGNRQAVII